MSMLTRLINFRSNEMPFLRRSYCSYQWKRQWLLYGCYNAKRKTCDNNLLVPRKHVEKIIISELKKNLTAENLKYVYRNLEKVIAKGLNSVPELIKRKKSQ